MSNFEAIGMLLERNALDHQIVWSQFSYAILYYHAACRSVIEHSRRDNPAAWTSFDYAAREMEPIERERHGSDDTLMSAQVRDFLETEVELANAAAQLD